VDIKIELKDVRYAYRAMARAQLNQGGEWEEWLNDNCSAFWNILSREMVGAAHMAYADQEAATLEFVNTRKLLVFVFAAIFSARSKTFPELFDQDAFDHLEPKDRRMRRGFQWENEIVQQMWKTNQYWAESFLEMQCRFKLSPLSQTVLLATIKILFDGLSREEAAEPKKEDSRVEP